MSEEKKETEEDRGYWSETFGLSNWKQKTVFIIAIVIYAALYQPFISKYSVKVSIALAAAFGFCAILLTALFPDKKPEKEEIIKRKESSSDDSKGEINDK
ncbi:MAG: hypothetical protein FVQ85_06210 [Planctomycetes bacterium]|nr:hypothetical protein [Planctomycetota bacterium]